MKDVANFWSKSSERGCKWNRNGDIEMGQKRGVRGRNFGNDRGRDQGHDRGHVHSSATNKTSRIQQSYFDNTAFSREITIDNDENGQRETVAISIEKQPTMSTCIVDMTDFNQVEESLGEEIRKCSLVLDGQEPEQGSNLPLMSQNNETNRNDQILLQSTNNTQSNSNFGDTNTEDKSHKTTFSKFIETGSEILDITCSESSLNNDSDYYKMSDCDSNHDGLNTIEDELSVVSINYVTEFNYGLGMNGNGVNLCAMIPRKLIEARANKPMPILRRSSSEMSSLSYICKKRASKCSILMQQHEGRSSRKTPFGESPFNRRKSASFHQVQGMPNLPKNANGMNKTSLMLPENDNLARSKSISGSRNILNLGQILSFGRRKEKTKEKEKEKETKQKVSSLKIKNKQPDKNSTFMHLVSSITAPRTTAPSGYSYHTRPAAPITAPQKIPAQQPGLAQPHPGLPQIQRKDSLLGKIDDKLLSILPKDVCIAVLQGHLLTDPHLRNIVKYYKKKLKEENGGGSSSEGSSIVGLDLKDEDEDEMSYSDYLDDGGESDDEVGEEDD